MIKSIRPERGQALVLVSFGLIGLLVVAGLAVDGGMTYLERRRMQNAADAASLAGTRMLAGAICNKPDVDDAAILAEVKHYAETNGVQNPEAVVADYVDADQTVKGHVGGGSIPNSATGISATVGISRSTVFVSLLGIDTASAGASALAMTGPVVQFSGGGMLPVGIHLSVVENLNAGDPFRVVDVLNHHSGGDFCVDENGNGGYSDPADWCVSDLDVPHNAQRGWLNLNYIYNKDHRTASDPLNRAREQNVSNSGCNTDPPGLQGYASGNCPYPDPIFAGSVGGVDGDFIHGSPGAKQSTLDEIEANYAGTGAVVYAPVFDLVYTPSDMEANGLVAPESPDGYHAGDWPNAGGGTHAFLYHIVGVAAMTISDTGGQGNQHYLDGVFQNMTTGEGLFSPSTGVGTEACDSLELYGVSLWR